MNFMLQMIKIIVIHWLIHGTKQRVLSLGHPVDYP